MRRPIPKIVGKLRYMCRTHPERKTQLVTAANRLLRDVNSINAKSAQWPHMASYRAAVQVIYQVSGEQWRGE